MKSNPTQQQFMQQYEKMHESFIRYCKAKAYGIIDYKDLVNETIARAFEAYPKLKNKEAFPAYLYSIAKNIIKNELRHRNVVKEAEIKMCSPETLTRNHAEGHFEVECLYQALALLPEQQKEAIILFEISGYSLKEIVEIQESSLSSVKQRLKRGREKLAVLLKEPRIAKVSTQSKSPVLLTLFF